MAKVILNEHQLAQRRLERNKAAYEKLCVAVERKQRKLDKLRLSIERGAKALTKLERERNRKRKALARIEQVVEAARVLEAPKPKAKRPRAHARITHLVQDLPTAVREAAEDAGLVKS